MISLLTLPSSFFAYNRHDGFCRISDLWSLSVIKAGVLAIHSMRLSRARLFFFSASKFIDVSNLGDAFYTFF